VITDLLVVIANCKHPLSEFRNQGNLLGGVVLHLVNKDYVVDVLELSFRGDLCQGGIELATRLLEVWSHFEIHPVGTQ
jgi:hypothetical protein